MADYYQQNQEFNFRRILPIAIIVGALFILIGSWSRMTETIDAGHAGVKFKYFSGLDKETIYGEGFHLLLPWDKIIVYDVTQQQLAEVMNVLSSNGLEIKVDVSMWFRPKRDELGKLHGELREGYVNKVVIPAIRSSARIVVGRYTPEELYSTKRDAITNEIFEETDKILKDKYVTVDRILIRQIELPPTIKNAIETKLKQEQETLEYEFRLAKATKEAERQKIEAEGKAKANDIISRSLTDKILTEKGIEATIRLSESPNSKVVVVGGGDKGLPLILGDK